MAELTYTRTDIRGAIARAARLEFFIRYGSNTPKPLGDGEAGSTHTTLQVNDTDLQQDSDFWAGEWLYIPTDSEERMIVASSSGGNLTLDWPLTSIPTSDDTYEIWGLWPPSMVNDAINRAQRHAWRFFPNIVEAETLVYTQDLQRRGLAASDFNQQNEDAYPGVADVFSVWLETSRTAIYGQVTSTSATVATFNDTAFSFDSDNVPDSDWLLSIYDGPARGYLREMVSVDSDGLFTVDTGFGVDLTSDSRYTLWNPTTDSPDEWYKLVAMGFDQPENPDFMYFRDIYPSANGMRLRVKYEAQSSDFGADSDITTTPLEFLLYKSLAFLYANLVGDNRQDRAAHAGLAEYYNDLSAQFAQQEQRNLPARTMWMERDPGTYSGPSNLIDPLGWRS